MDQIRKVAQAHAARAPGSKQDDEALQALERLGVWQQKPVAIVDWLSDSYYCDVAESIYPEVRRHLCTIFAGDHLEVGLGTGPSPNGGNIREVVLCWGIGSGKSFLTSLATAYVLYRLGCMRDPAEAMGLAPGSDVVITNVSVSEEQAKKVIFSEIKKRVDGSPWFADHFAPNPRVKRELQFPNGVKVFPGASTATKVLGLNVIMGMIDEAAFHPEIRQSQRAYMTADSAESYSGAVELYHALQERCQSRFGLKWLLMIVSSPLFVGDFIQAKLKEFALGTAGMYGGHAAQWQIKPPRSYGPGSFFINPLTREMFDEVPEDWTGEVQLWER